MQRLRVRQTKIKTNDFTWMEHMFCNRKWDWRNNTNSWDFPGGPGKNLPSSAGDVGLIPGWGSKIPDAVAQPSRWAPREKSTCHSEDPAQPKKKKKKNTNSSLDPYFLTYEINNQDLVVFKCLPSFTCHVIGSCEEGCDPRYLIINLMLIKV